MAQDLTLAMRLLLNSQQFISGLTGSGRAVTGFASTARNELGRLRDAYSSVQGRFAAIGAGVGATATVIQSAKLDKSLTQIGLTAGAGAGQIETLRNRIFELARDSGKDVDDLTQGFNSLVQSGLSFDQALATLTGINDAMAVTSANAEVLARGVTVAGRAFQFDLKDPKTALSILQQMTVAGRLGNAELEDLAGVFGRVGTAASKSGMKFDETLALIEGLSQSLPGQPERLATRAESTLRLFTNMNYLKAAQSASGVRFFDPTTGARRETTAVFVDMKKKFDTLGTDLARAKWIQKAFGMADLDTQTGIFEILSGNNLQQMQGFRTTIAAASDTFKNDMDTALNNAVDQTGRLRATLRSAADAFAKPVNDVLSRLIKFTLDRKQDGGLGLSGGQIAGVGIGALVGGYALKRVTGGIFGNLLGTAGGVAAGKALEKAAGVTPVFVTNMPAGVGAGGLMGAAGAAAAGGAAVKVLSDLKLLTKAPLGIVSRMGAGVMTASAGLVGAAGLAGYGVGSLIYKAIDDTRFADKIGEGVARALALFGNDTARQSLKTREAEERFQGSLKIELISPDLKAQVRQFRVSSPSLDIDLEHRGLMMGHP